MSRQAVAGEIKYRSRARQLNDFSRLERLRGITPTDIDGLIDYDGKAFIYLEGKYNGKRIDSGQRRALENACKSHFKSGKLCKVFLFAHEVHDPKEDVMVDECEVTEIYTVRSDWRSVHGRTVLEWIEQFEEDMNLLGINF